MNAIPFLAFALLGLVIFVALAKSALRNSFWLKRLFSMGKPHKTQSIDKAPNSHAAHIK
mgnify:CR=1 FL=1